VFFLALNAAISKGFTGGACLQFYFVDFRDAAGSANVGRLSVFAAHYFNLFLFFIMIMMSEVLPSKQAASEAGRESGKSVSRQVLGCLLFRLPSLCVQKNTS
jgi:hypothetical protein